MPDLVLTRCGLVTPIWWHKSWSTVAQIMACSLTAPSHYLCQCWLIISKVPWHSSESNFKRCLSHHSLKLAWKSLKFCLNLPRTNELIHIYYWAFRQWERIIHMQRMHSPRSCSVIYRKRGMLLYSVSNNYLNWYLLEFSPNLDIGFWIYYKGNEARLTSWN